jgi:hypothetical protein
LNATDQFTKMSDVIELDAIFDAPDFVMRKTPGDDSRVSIIDFVRYATGQTKSRARETIANLEIENKDFFGLLVEHQFSGRGERNQYVLNCSEGFELTMMLPGSKAKEFRKLASHIVSRVFAGDPTLHNVIDQNGLSNGVANQWARAELRSKEEVLMDGQLEALELRIKTMTAEHQLSSGALQHKYDTVVAERKHEYDMELTAFISDSNMVMAKSKQKYKMEAFEWHAKQESMDMMGATYIESVPEDEKDAARDWIRASKQDYNRRMFKSSFGTVSPPLVMQGPVDMQVPVVDDMQKVFISKDLIAANGLKDPGYKLAQGVGKIAARMYRDSNDGRDPPKTTSSFDGKQINTYYKKDMPLLWQAWEEYDATHGVTASQAGQKHKRDEELATYNDRKRMKTVVPPNQPSVADLFH